MRSTRFAPEGQLIVANQLGRPAPFNYASSLRGCNCELKELPGFAGFGDISPEHVSEAIQYRTFDRTLWV
jgi:hypothetical protein